MMTLWTSRATRLATAGAAAIAAALALVRQLDFAVSSTGAIGRDWACHLPRATRVLATGFHPSRVLSLYDAWIVRDAVMIWPPLGHVVAAAFMAPRALNPVSAYYASQAIWIAVLVGSLYGAGRRLGRGAPTAGLVAALLGGLIPTVLDLARQVNLEFATTATVALAFYGFARSENLTSTAGSLVLGLCCGVAFLTKPVTFAYVVPFLAFAFLLGADGRAAWARRGGRLLLAAATATLVCGALYLPRVRAVLHDGGVVSRDLTSVWRLNLAVFPRFVAVGLLSPVAWVLVIASAVAGLRRRDGVTVSLLAGGCVAFAYLATLIYSETNTAYYFPFAVLAALVVARGLPALGRYGRPAATVALAAMVVPSLLAPEWVARRVAATPRSAFVRAMFPTDGAGAAPFARPRETVDETPNLRLAHLLFANRYAAFGSEDVGIVEESWSGYESIQAGIGVARTEGPGRWNVPASIVGAIYCVGDDASRLGDLERVISRPLVIAVRSPGSATAPPRGPDPLGRALDRVGLTHRTDLAFDALTDGRGTAVAGRPAIAVFVRDRPDRYGYTEATPP